MSKNETTQDPSDSVEEQLAEISEFDHKIRLLRWGMVTGTLLIIAIGVINIIGKVNKAAEPVEQVLNDVQGNNAFSSENSSFCPRDCHRRRSL